MTKKACDIIGIIVGVLMIAFAVVVFASTPQYTSSINSGSTNAKEIDYSAYTEYEDNKWYGGDAYTGIQQAAAQAANNLIAVNNSVETSNEYLYNINKNLDGINYTIEHIGSPLQNNFSIFTDYLKMCLALVFVSAGLLTITKYTRNLCKESVPKKKNNSENPQPNAESDNFNNDYNEQPSTSDQTTSPEENVPNLADDKLFLTTENNTTICPQCNFKQPGDIEFCTCCGTKLL